MKFYNGGYTSILYSDYLEFSDTFIYTASTCINYTIPDYWALSWTKIQENDKQRIKKYLMTNLNEFQEYMDRRFEENEFCWPNLFANVNRLYECNDKYISPDYKLIEVGLSFPEIELNEITKQLTPNSEKVGQPGLLKILNLKHETTNNKYFGFDIIGIELGGEFHSFHCNALDEEYKNKFGIILNEYGLINTIEECMRIINWTNLDETGCEPVPWFICRIDDKRKNKL